MLYEIGCRVRRISDGKLGMVRSHHLYIRWDGLNYNSLYNREYAETYLEKVNECSTK